MDIQQLAHAARQAARPMAALSSAVKDRALLRIAADLQANTDLIFAANRQDIARSTTAGLPAPLLKRLNFGQKKLDDVVSGLKSLTSLPDPVGRTQLATRLDEGLDLYRVSSPIGVIGVIFESRPDALVQISSLCLKSGNCVLLKGGSEARETNRILAGIIEEASLATGLPAGWLGLLESRADVQELLTLDQDVDLIIPRGSNEFVRKIMDGTRIPVLGHADGVCHLYIDRDCDPAMAVKLAVDGKTQYVAVCNATETILLHASLADTLLVHLAEALKGKGVEIFGCSRVCARLGCPTAEEWHHEYLDLKVSLKLVDDLEDAINHINHYGSHHTDAIVTEDRETASRFLQDVDSGNVFWNCSTRFSDGFNYGFGAEVGISTSKFHARGPVGLEGLQTYKYCLLGRGQAIGDYASGANHFRHEPLEQSYPLQEGPAF